MNENIPDLTVLEAPKTKKNWKIVALAATGVVCAALLLVKVRQTSEATEALEELPQAETPQ